LYQFAYLPHDDGSVPLWPSIAYARRVETPTDRKDAMLDGVMVAHRPALLRYLRARGAGEEAEDLLQELWLKVAALEDDGAIADPLPYLYRMAHNLMLDRRRATRRRMARELDYGTPDPQGAAQEAVGTERALVARDSLRHIDAALAALGERTDYIFRRHRVEGVAQKQIAEELGITVSGVEKYLQKAYRAVLAARRRIEGGEGR
jgi:RNA polymerase sigma-70 factor (ECF subfamily)